MPLGPSATRLGVNFSVFTRRATSVTLVLFPPETADDGIEIPLDRNLNRTGDVWHVHVEGVEAGIAYGFRMDRDPNPRPKIDRFDPRQLLIDPYGPALESVEAEGADRHPESPLPAPARQWRSLILDHEFQWDDDRQLNIHSADSIIYEMHVRGFTRHPSSQVGHPGTFQGVAEKIPYLLELGITAVELMPVFQFDSRRSLFTDPETGRALTNYWGYDPLSFFAPHQEYSSQESPGAQVAEFKAMVKALHAAGIEVILDVVFNHTAEGGADGQVTSFRGIDNQAYYLIDPDSGEYLNYSGCGNTVNCNHPVVRDMILRSLRYWVTEMHVDGFRFDLASILARGRDGRPLPDPPLLERIAHDPVLDHCKLIAEAWDAAGLYQVGAFPNFGRWAEWNGHYRDDLRRFVKSDPGFTRALAARLAGSPDLYRNDGRGPHHSINFITCHDGFTLNDLVSYDRRHNHANGEGNQDGNPVNFSWNCGQEGPSRSPEVSALRRRQVRNLTTLLLLSQGVPMILAGDEMGRSQLGNNNAYCRDDETSWIDWNLLRTHHDLHRFFKHLIAFRKNTPILRGRGFISRRDDPRSMVWHGQRLGRPDWSREARCLAMHLFCRHRDSELHLMANAHWESRSFELPRLGFGRRWYRFVDTFLHSPDDITAPGRERILARQNEYLCAPRSVVVLVAKAPGSSDPRLEPALPGR